MTARAGLAWIPRAARPSAGPEIDQLIVDVRPPSPYRLPSSGSADGTIRVRSGQLVRFFAGDGSPALVAARQVEPDLVRFTACPATRGDQDEVATEEHLQRAISRFRFALGVDDDLTEFLRRFRRDRLLGPILRWRPSIRPARQSSPWEAFAWAVVGQLIEAERAAKITRAIVRGWGPRGPGDLADAPSSQVIAERAPAELQAVDLAAARSAAVITVARDVCRGRIDLARRASDEALMRYPQVGPWTVACLGFYGRGEPDSLPAGDLDYLKIVGRLRGLGRRAEVEEVEELFEPYRPYRGLAGAYLRRAARAGMVPARFR